MKLPDERTPRAWGAARCILASKPHAARVTWIDRSAGVVTPSIWRRLNSQTGIRRQTGCQLYLGKCDPGRIEFSYVSADVGIHRGLGVQDQQVAGGVRPDRRKIHVGTGPPEVELIGNRRTGCRQLGESCAAP